MPVAKTKPIFTCRRCGQGLFITHTFFTYDEIDPDGSLLPELMQGLAKIALCERCEARRNYYISQGREEDWEKGNF